MGVVVVVDLRQRLFLRGNLALHGWETVLHLFARWNNVELGVYIGRECTNVILKRFWQGCGEISGYADR